MRIIVLAVGAIMKDIRKYWLFSGRNAAVTSFSIRIINTNLNYNIHMHINIYGKYGLRWITFWSIKPFYLKHFRFLDKEIVTLSVKKSPKDINTYGKSDKASYFGFISEVGVEYDVEAFQQSSECRFKNEPKPKYHVKFGQIKVMLWGIVCFDYRGVVHHEFVTLFWGVYLKQFVVNDRIGVPFIDAWIF